MLTWRRVLLPLRALLVLMFAVLVMLETFSLPGQFAHLAREHPEDAGLRWPLTAVTVFWVVCVQVVIVCTWRLLSLVTSDRIFSPASMGWVNGIVGAIGAAWIALVGFFLWTGFHADDPGIVVLLFLLLIAVSVFGLLMVVMRALLHQATTLRSDMEAVI